MAYTIIFKSSADRQLRRLPVRVQKRIVRAIEALADDPRPPGVIKLTGDDAWRVRIGDYRVIYDIHDDRLVVLVLAVGHRREIYR